MTEQSVGMETGTGTPFGDGNVGTGYASSRMTAMETKTLSDGVRLTGSLLTMTGNGTNTLSIADGDAIVGGYFYQNTSSKAIVITSLANATYNVAILVNSTTGALTVSRSVSGTTVLAKTVRLVVATDAMVSTWISAGYSYLILGTVQVSGAVITASGITPNYAMYATTTQLPYQSYATMSGGTATLTATNTAYDVTGYGAPTVTSDNIFSANNTTGVITVRRAGLYSIGAFVNFTNATTGTRTTMLKVGATIVQRNMMPPGAANAYSTSLFLAVLAANDTVTIAANTITTAAQSVSDCIFTISRA